MLHGLVVTNPFTCVYFIVDPVQEDLTSLASYPEYDIFFHYDAVVFPAGLVKLLKRVVIASR